MDSEKNLGQVMHKLKAARDNSLNEAQEELKKFASMPSATLWEQVTDRYKTVTQLDIRFGDLFDCIKDKIKDNPDFNDTSEEESNKQRKAALQDKLRIMFDNREIYTKKKVIARKAYDKAA